MSDSKLHRPEDFDAALRARIEAQLADVEPDFEDMMRRAQELFDEIRRRSGEQSRPEVELDYLKRLLDRF